MVLTLLLKESKVACAHLCVQVCVQVCLCALVPFDDVLMCVLVCCVCLEVN